MDYSLDRRMKTDWNMPTHNRWKRVEALRKQLNTAVTTKPRRDRPVTLRGQQFSIRIEVYIFTAFVAILHHPTGRRWKLIFDSGTRGYEIARETVEARRT